MLLLFAAVQILFNLYANTMVTSAAHEAARRVAGHTAATDRCAAIDDANALFADALGAYGDEGFATLTWDCTDSGVVTVDIVANHPTILPSRLSGLVGLGRLERTITVRIEQYVG